MIRTLNSLRFILILMIVISHSTLPISQDLINYLGEFPVAIFFVISGFVLSLSKGEKLQKEELGNRNFFLSRIIKLYPLHILILAILGSGIAVYRNVFSINPLQSEHSLCHYLLDTISHNRVLFYSKRSR